MAKIPTDSNLISPMGDLSFAVAIGAITGYTSFRKFGMNPGVPVGTEEMWPVGTIRTLPTTAAVAVLSSDSPEDDPDDGVDAGTGAHEVVVQGLDENFLEVQETVALNGTANSSSTQTFLRINRMFIQTVGTNGTNVGNITATVGGAAQAYIEAGEGQTHQTGYCVPAGKTLIVTGYHIGIGRMAGNTDAHILADIRLRNATDDGYYGWRTISDIYLYNGQKHTNAGTATVIPAKTDIRQRVASTATTQAWGIYEGYLIDQATQGNF